MNGLLHVLIGVNAIHMVIAHGGRPSEAGVMSEISGLPGGFIALWVAFIALLALGVWQTLEVLFGRRYTSKRQRVLKKSSASGLAIIYIFLAVATASFALDDARRRESLSEKSQLSLELMQTTPGRLLLVVLGATIFGFGTFFIVKGLRRTHRKDLISATGVVGAAAVVLGTIGYIAKGAVICGAGTLVAYSAFAYNPDKAEGISAVFQTVRRQPYGPTLLTAAGVGLVCYGLYLGYRAKNGKMANDY